jgi:hypothetical protein
MQMAIALSIQESGLDAFLRDKDERRLSVGVEQSIASADAIRNAARDLKRQKRRESAKRKRNSDAEGKKRREQDQKAAEQAAACLSAALEASAGLAAAAAALATAATATREAALARSAPVCIPMAHLDATTSSSTAADLARGATVAPAEVAPPVSAVEPVELIDLTSSSEYSF